MSTAVAPPAADPLAQALGGEGLFAAHAALVTGHPVERWQEAVTGSGGEVRARWLVRSTGIPLARLSPQALLLSHVAASLLEVGPRPAPPP